MQEDFRLILDIVTVLAAAAAGGFLASLLRQPVLLGYLLAGILVGPTGLGWIKELVQVETLAQFGVTFLLFTLGGRTLHRRCHLCGFKPAALCRPF